MVKVKRDDGKETFIVLKYYKHEELEDGTIRVEFSNGMKGTVIDEKAEENIREIVKDDEDTDGERTYPVYDWLNDKTTKPFDPVKWVEGND